MNTMMLLKKLISIPSIFPNENMISEFLKKYLEDLGFSVRVIQTKPNRYNLIATFGKSKKYLGLYGHMDTVAPGEQRKTNPFEMTIKNSKAFGLGVADMKG